MDRSKAPKDERRVSRVLAHRYSPVPVRGICRSVADIFDELNQDLRDERARAMAKRYGVAGGIVVLLVLAGVGGWQGWKWHERQLAEAAAPAFLAAMHQADALQPGNDPGRLPAADAFAKVAASAPAGYAALARLREAALRWDAGDSIAALGLWDGVGNDGAVDAPLRDLAALLWAQHSVDKGDPAAIGPRTAKLEAAGNPWRALAEEVDALVALRQDDKDKATRLLRAVLTDPLAADGLRGRASALLTLLGAPLEAKG